MKDYNEMAKSVFEKRDAYITAQKKKRAMLLKAGIPLCSLVLVTMMSLLLWQAKLPEMPKKPEEPTVNISEQTNPDDTSEGAINSQVGEITGVQYSSVQAMQSQGTGTADNEYMPKPTQPFTQKYTGDLPQSQGGKPYTEPTAPQPNTDGVVHPDSPDKPVVPGILGKPEHTNCTMSEDCVPPTYVPEAPATLPGEEMTLPAFPNEGNPNEYPFATGGVETTEPVTMPTTSSVPEPTGPLEITVADKTYTAQVGDKVTYTVELMAPKRFENIQIALRYNSDYLKLVIPEDVVDKQCAKTTPNMTGAFVGYNPNVFRLVASSVAPKYDFRQKKVLFTIDFLVRKPGETECDFMVEVMSVYIGPSPSEDIHYFSYGEQLVFDGITFYHNISVN